jgi:PHD/YefM family antitoxin component YafN of YafNO toxin-antitoxin module
MKVLELEKASKPLADYASDLGSDSLVITSNNKPVAALISIKDADRESLALGLSPEFGKIIRRARAEAKKGKVFSLKQVKGELLGKSTEPGKVHTTAERHRRSGGKKSSGRG